MFATRIVSVEGLVLSWALLGCGSSGAHAGGGDGGASRSDGALHGGGCDARCADASTGADARGGGDTGGGMPPESCTDCQAEAASGACAAQATACENSESCGALLTCVDGCTDAACVDNCRTSNTAGLSTYDNFSNCLCAPPCASLCASECVSIDRNDAGNACGACQVKATTSGGACYAQSSSCNSSSTCVALLDCLDGCPANDTPCTDACNGKYPSGKPGVGAVDKCLCTPAACASQCPAQCGG